MKLSLKKTQMAEIIEHAKHEFPNEACGLLAGKNTKVSKVYQMANTERGGMRYSMVLKEQFDAARDMRSQNLEMIGIYHSHPNVRPYPSFRDIQRAMHPECSYVIISLINGMPEVRSFRIIKGMVTEEEIDAG
jgi:proteasome lid subunit RPN8/RPN11